MALHIYCSNTAHRFQIRNHANTLCCSHVVGYTETCTVHGDVCILIATGTAAVVKVRLACTPHSTLLLIEFV
jgi:hypothetical protein